MNTPELFIVGAFVTTLVSAGVALPIIGSILDRRAVRAEAVDETGFPVTQP
jgi:hypothetical protein